MSEEYKYLKNKREEKKAKVRELKRSLISGGAGGRIGEDYRNQITELEKEITLIDRLLICVISCS